MLFKNIHVCEELQQKGLDGVMDKGKKNNIISESQSRVGGK